MANNPSNFPFLVGGLPDQPQEFAGGVDVFPAPPNLPLVISSKVRYWALSDTNTGAIKMWRSGDSGRTWAQFDSVNAPMMPADGTGPPVIKIWNYYNAVWDGADTIYVVAWHPTFVVALFPFKISTKTWQPAIVSTLTYLDQTTVRVSGVGGFAACFRPSDGAVWMAFQAGGQDATDICTVWGAKCIPGGAGWDGALTRLAGTYQDGLFHIIGTLALDPATNKIHALYQRSIFGANGTISVTTLAGLITASSIVTPGAGYPFPSVIQAAQVFVFTTGDNITGGFASALGPQFLVGQPSGNPDGTVVSEVPSINGNGSLVHRVINPNDTLTAEQTVFDLASNGISNALSALKIAGGQMAFTFLHGGGTFAAGARRKVGRALIGDAPAWEITEPAAANNVGDLTGVFPQLMDIMRQAGVDYLIYGYFDNSGFDNSVHEFATSAGIGAGWSAGTFIAFADNQPGPIFYGADTLVPVGLPVGSAAFGMFAGTNNGQAYFEFALPRCQVGTMKGVGVLIKDWQGKAYMNDFVPAELIFGFDNSQTPGLVYPEIYIPKNQALYLDVAPFGPINGLLTLTFKGKKVYE
jgi:hypothetical protein